MLVSLGACVIAQIECEFMNEVSNAEIRNIIFEKNSIKVLNLDFHIETGADKKTTDRNVYTNIYTLHLPSTINYTDVINHLASYSNIQVVRVTNT